MGVGLYPVVLDVVRSDTGRPHKQRYWVRGDEIREAVEAGSAGSKQMIGRLGGDPGRALEWIRAWNISSAEPTAMKWSAAVKGGVLDPEREALHRFVKANEVYPWAPSQSDMRTANAVAIVSQEAHGGPGGETTLYRGLNLPVSVLHRLARGETVDLAASELSSWSENPEIAKNFTVGVWTGHVGLTIRKTIPNHAIAYSHRLSMGRDSTDHEQEVVVHTHGVLRIRPEDVESLQVPVHLLRSEHARPTGEPGEDWTVVVNGSGPIPSEYQEQATPSNTWVRPVFGRDQRMGVFWRNGTLFMRTFHGGF